MSAAAVEATGGAPRRPRTLPDRLLGALGFGMILLAAVVLLVGGPEDSGTRPLAVPAALELLEPVAGAELAGPLTLLFRVEGGLEPQRSGWGRDGMHLHLALDGLELMPGAADLQELGGGRYRWTVGPLEAGPHTLRLFWSDAAHAAVAGGESEAVEVVAR